jgi:LacI family transcriptional regulator
MATTQPKMKDVAALAGVSIKTVSRVLNNEPHVQHALRERVREAVISLGYVPSKSARSLRSSRSYTINMLCRSDISNYVNAIQFGAVIACQQRGYQLTISITDTIDGKSVAEIKDELGKLTAHSSPDGVILVAPFADNPDIVQAFDELSIPVARIGPSSGSDSRVHVGINEHQASYEVTNHLLDLGHKHIGFVRGLENQAVTEERFRGYRDALLERGLKVNRKYVRKGKFDFRSGVRAAEKLLALDPPVTAIFASNDDMAAGVMMVANRQGVNVPRELSVVGFDDSEIAENMWPSLTTVRQPLQQLGEVSALKLIEILGQSAPPVLPPTILPHEVIIRESTAACSNNEAG